MRYITPNCRGGISNFFFKYYKNVKDNNICVVARVRNEIVNPENFIVVIKNDLYVILIKR